MFTDIKYQYLLVMAWGVISLHLMCGVGFVQPE